MLPFRRIIPVLCLALWSVSAWAGPPFCQQALLAARNVPSAREHLALQTRLDRLRYLRGQPPKNEIRALERQLRELESVLRSNDPRGAAEIIADNRLQSIDELYAYFSAEKEKYDAFHPSWRWRKSQPGRNERFGKRFEKVTLAYLEEHGVSVEPHYEGRLRDGVTLVPDAKGTYLNRLAFRLNRRWGIHLVVSPRNLVAEATDGMFASAARDVYVSKDLLRTFQLETTTRHEVIHAYIDSLGERGLATPFDAELNALEGKTISPYETAGYDEYEDASEVATYAQEVTDGAAALRAVMRESPDETALRELIAAKLDVPAQEGRKLTQAMLDGLKDALKSVESGEEPAAALGKVSEGRNPAFAYADIPVGERATLTLRLVSPADVSLVREGASVQALVISRLKRMIELDERMLELYSGVTQDIASALENPTPDRLQRLADSSLLPKRLAFSGLPGL